MGSIFANTEKLISSNKGNYWGERIAYELSYAYRVSMYDQNKWDSLIQEAIELALSKNIDEQVCHDIENMMAPMADKLKSYSLHCCSHSHMDLNFLWGYDETVSIVLATFQTMLTLLDEYEDFIYSQSQAAAYEIVEKYAPHMIERIKKYVHEGRWEITASTFVEADKNMPNGESFAQQVFYAKSHLSKLFEISPDTIRVDFEPDTFGHNKNMPQILKNAGVEYYYFCRGEGNKNNIFNWKSDNGDTVIAYKEPHWYDSRIQKDIVFTVPEFCHNNHVDTMMKVYGVGDHGGGPTKRDLERLLDMAKWPLYPTIKFSTYHAYFDHISQFSKDFPFVNGELHSIFTGCLTSQADLKQLNRKSEIMLSQAETLSAFCEGYIKSTTNRKLLDEGWKKTLFNQFHDIITGSCIPQVKYFAAGKAQEVFACANAVKSEALSKIAAQIDTSRFQTECNDCEEMFSMGAGAGVFVKNSFAAGLADKGVGRTRIFHLFNTTEFERNEVCEVVLWDWNGDINQIRIHDTNGNNVKHQLVKNEFSEEWGHYYLKILVDAKVPSFGYTTLILCETDEYELEDTNRMDTDYLLVKQNLPPCEEYKDFILENDNIKVVIDHINFSIKSFYDKNTGTELCKTPMGVFNIIDEDPFNGGGNAWLIGRYVKKESIKNFRLLGFHIDKSILRQSIEIAVDFLNSSIKVNLILDANSNQLEYEVLCDWHEFSRENEIVKQLSFALPVGYQTNKYLFDIPFSTIERNERDVDVCANSFVIAKNEDYLSDLMLTSDSKYGYRCYDNTMNLNLLRGSFMPDTCPDQGEHTIRFAVGAVDSNNKKAVFKNASCFSNPVLSINAAPSNGSLPPMHSFIKVNSNNAVVSSFKMSSVKEKTMLIRVYEINQEKSTVIIECNQVVKKAYAVDFIENPLDELIIVKDNTVEVPMTANGLQTIAIEI